MSCWQAMHNLLWESEFESLRGTERNLTERELKRLMFEPKGDYPTFIRRRMHIIGIDKTESWQELVRDSRYGDIISTIAGSSPPEKYGARILTDPSDKKRVMDFVASAPHANYVKGRV